MKRNKGFTLVELIVVIAILGILAVSATVSVSLITSRKARQAVKTVDSMISQCRVATLSGAQNAYLKLSAEGKEYYVSYYENGEERGKEKLGGETLACAFMADTTEHAITETQPLCLAFDPRTGAFLPLRETPGFHWSGGESCRAIMIQGYTVALTPTTGYHRLEE